MTEQLKPERRKRLLVHGRALPEGKSYGDVALEALLPGHTIEGLFSPSPGVVRLRTVDVHGYIWDASLKVISYEMENQDD